MKYRNLQFLFSINWNIFYKALYWNVLSLYEKYPFSEVIVTLLKIKEKLIGKFTDSFRLLWNEVNDQKDKIPCLLKTFDFLLFLKKILKLNLFLYKNLFPCKSLKSFLSCQIHSLNICLYSNLFKHTNSRLPSLLISLYQKSLKTSRKLYRSF
jgi:hypothetical protein